MTERPKTDLPLARISSVGSVKTLQTATALRELLDSAPLFWIDIVGGEKAAQADLLRQLGLGEADIEWVQRFGQTGRMTISREKLRSVTWLSQSADDLTEVHVLRMRNFILTLWEGNAATLDDALLHFAERVEQLSATPYRAAAIVLQLLLGTLNQAISDLDGRFQVIQRQLDEDPTAIEPHPASTWRLGEHRSVQQRSEIGHRRH